MSLSPIFMLTAFAMHQKCSLLSDVKYDKSLCIQCTSPNEPILQIHNQKFHNGCMRVFGG